MLEFLVAIIAFALVLGVIVTVHEFGHFYFAKKAGILCSEFAIGMGPVIYKRKKGETYYTIRAIPVGGFVSMAGEDMTENIIKEGSKISLQLENNLVTELIIDPKIESDVSGVVVSLDLYGKENNELYIEVNINNEIRKYNINDECYYVLPYNQRVPVAPYNRCFESKTLMQRFLTLFAGPAMNLILALVMFLIVGLATGVPTNDNVIGSVTTNTASQFLNEGDVITDISGYKIDCWDDISIAMTALKSIGDDYIYITIEGEDTPIEVLASIQINSIGITNIGTFDVDYDGPGVVLGELATGNKAYEAGLRKNDILIGVTSDNIYYEINSWSDAIKLFDSLDSAKIKIDYISAEENKTTGYIDIFNNDTLDKLKTSKIMYQIGISPTTKFDFIGGVKNGFVNTWNNATLIFSTLSMIINPAAQVSVSDLSGPVGIFSLIQTYLSAGVVTFFALVGMLSINFFVVNLIPFPALDGGRLVFLGYEAVTKKPVNKELENKINTIGFILLMALMLYVTFNDILRIG